MSLFVCDKCKCVENTNLNTKDLDKGNKDFPNLSSMEMAGFGKDYAKTQLKSEQQYLCSECNTGTWHGEFEKTQATEEELELSKYSETRLITPGNHPVGCLQGSYNEGYKVDDRYKLFVKLFGKDISKDNNVLFKIYLEDRQNFDIRCLHDLDTNYYSRCNIDSYIYYNNIFSGYVKYVTIDGMNMVEIYGLPNEVTDGYKKEYVLLLTVLDSTAKSLIDNIEIALEVTISDNVEVVNDLKDNDDFKCLDGVSIIMAVRASQIYKTEGKSKTYYDLIQFKNQKTSYGLSSTGSFTYDYLKELKKSKPVKKHWKETQSKNAKEAMLRRADLKRSIKALKKQYPRLLPDDKLLELENLEKESKLIKEKINSNNI